MIGKDYMPVIRGRQEKKAIRRLLIGFILMYLAVYILSITMGGA